MTATLIPLRPDQLGAAEAILQQACEHDLLHLVASEKLFAPAAPAAATTQSLRAEPLGIFLGKQLAGVACTSGSWIRLLAIGPEHRGRGFGAALLERSEMQIAKHGREAALLAQPGNYLSPGLDKANTESLRWLEKRGYRRCGTTTNLLIDVQSNPKVGHEPLRRLAERCLREGYELERMSESEVNHCCEEVAQNFSAPWAFEVRRAFEQSAGVHIARHTSSGHFAAFAAHDGNNSGLGWFGPMGTLTAHRGHGLGSALLMRCLLDINKIGLRHCQVAWIGPRKFYETVAGVARERHFWTMRKEHL